MDKGDEIKKIEGLQDKIAKLIEKEIPNQKYILIFSSGIEGSHTSWNFGLRNLSEKDSGGLTTDILNGLRGIYRHLIEDPFDDSTPHKVDTPKCNSRHMFG